MGKRIRIIVMTILAAGVWLAAGSGWAKEPTGCGGPFDGKKPTREELERVLAAHKAWWREFEKFPEDSRSDTLNDKRRANLCGADLSGADLSRAVLPRARLDRADLFGANLSGANLSDTFLGGSRLNKADLSDAMLRKANLANAILWQANLRNADLREAKVIQANLREADLSGADLARAVLVGANLSDTVLHGADLTGVSLQEADLIGTDLSEANLTATRLSKADLSGADLSGAWFDPVANELPRAATVARARNLSRMRSHDGAALSALKEQLKAGGFARPAREVAAAIKRAEDFRKMAAGRLSEWFMGMTGYVLFGLTCDYGARPFRLLGLLAGLTGVFALFYMEALTASGGGRWIVAVWGDGSRFPRRRQRVTPLFFMPGAHRKIRNRGQRLSGRLWWAFWGGLYFSTLVTFRIGWRNMALGSWLSLLQRQDYALVPVGKLRFVAGVQSIIGVYLLALLLLTFFRPLFEV